MPRAKNPYSQTDAIGKFLNKGFGIGVKTQLQLLAEQGWRKVPSEDAISARILSLILEYNNIPPEHKADANLAIWVGWRVHRWLMEGG